MKRFSSPLAPFLVAVIAVALTGCGPKTPSPDEATTAAVETMEEAADGAGPNEETEESSMDQLAKEYVMLILELGNHDKNYVDAYYGPEDWLEKAKASEASAADIAERAEILMAKLPAQVAPSSDMDTLRTHYLKTQLRAVLSHARALAGEEKPNFEREAKELYDTEPPRQDFSEFEPVLAELEALLPGEEPLHERVDAFRKQYEIPADSLSAVFDAAIEECRERTKKHMSLPEAESFVLEYVKDKPWSGYNWYKGNSQSLIQINTELPIMIDRAVDLGCHEGYPGHHTYNALLEEKLVDNRNWIEYSVYPLFSPQSLIAEGSANYGIELAFPGDEKLAFEKEQLYPLAGLDPDTAEKYSQVMKLVGKLSFSGNEVARRYINGEIDADEATELFQKYALMSPGKARQRVRFVDTYGAYVINYNWGKKLVADYVESGATGQDARWARFSRLLSSPRLPSSLNW